MDYMEAKNLIETLGNGLDSLGKYIDDLQPPLSTGLRSYWVDGGFDESHYEYFKANIPEDKIETFICCIPPGTKWTDKFIKFVNEYEGMVLIELGFKIKDWDHAEYWDNIGANINYVFENIPYEKITSTVWFESETYLEPYWVGARELDYTEIIKGISRLPDDLDYGFYPMPDAHHDQFENIKRLKLQKQLVTTLKFAKPDMLIHAGAAPSRLPNTPEWKTQCYEDLKIYCSDLFYGVYLEPSSSYIGWTSENIKEALSQLTNERFFYWAGWSSLHQAATNMVDVIRNDFEIIR